MGFRAIDLAVNFVVKTIRAVRLPDTPPGVQDPKSPTPLGPKADSKEVWADSFPQALRRERAN